MKSNYLQRFAVALILLAITLVTGCAQNTTENKKPKSTEEVIKDTIKYKVTFIELGSVRCIPCKQMQPIMKSIEKKYGDKVKVVFHDIWTPEGKPFADQFQIQVIPTQVFLDENGKEFFRHEGYFPEEELIEVLKTKGVK
jgi:thioredoxin 1